MNKATLLTITLLLCPALTFSMDKEEFPALPKKKCPVSVKKTSKSVPVTETKENNTNNLSRELEIPHLDTVNEKSIETNMPENNKSQITFFTEGNSPVEQEKRGLFGKLWSIGKSYRDLSVYWLNLKEIPEKNREQAQNDVKWAITEENKAIKSNRNGNEDFIALLKICEKDETLRHEMVLKMATYLKKNENHTSYLEMFVHADEKGLPFDNSKILDDTYKMLQSEDKHDFFVLGLLTLEVMNRVQKRQKTRNHIYEQTKDNKTVVGHFSDRDYNKAQVVYDKTQLLMLELANLKNKQEQEELLKKDPKEKK